MSLSDSSVDLINVAVISVYLTPHLLEFIYFDAEVIYKTTIVSIAKKIKKNPFLNKKL